MSNNKVEYVEEGEWIEKYEEFKKKADKRKKEYLENIDVGEKMKEIYDWWTGTGLG